ncbi:hypothetical protein AVEN_168989-1 [Araneus ventricosus]|uniref:Uncharacterized protein n=1 Tax=Araneus ventricosus TaxID=182803 RepID=A0A4Y2KE87_ARAVE|nr:hypothetical protein AVEN_168989-1 [Araneus ventricosus]
MPNLLSAYYLDAPQFKTLVTRYPSVPLIDNRKGKFRRGRPIFSTKKLAFLFSAEFVLACVCPPLRVFIDAIDLKERTNPQRTGCLFVGNQFYSRSVYGTRLWDDFGENSLGCWVEIEQFPFKYSSEFLVKYKLVDGNYALSCFE